MYCYACAEMSRVCRETVGGDRASELGPVILLIYFAVHTSGSAGRRFAKATIILDDLYCICVEGIHREIIFSTLILMDTELNVEKKVCNKDILSSILH